MTLAQYEALPEDERALWVAEHEIEATLCPQHHGPREECRDANKPWYPQRSICHMTMVAAAVDWRYDQKYGGKFHDGTFKNWSDTRSVSYPYGHRDGVATWVAPVDLTPDDDFL